MNAAMKSFAERAAVRSGFVRIARARRRDGALVLAYHDIVPSGERATGDSSLHLAQGEFARQLDELARTHDVVPLATLTSEGGGAGRPRVAITFDDAYAGALRAGVQELERRQMPATIFVAPALLGEVTWWDLLVPPKMGEIAVQVRERALWQLAGKRALVLAWAADGVERWQAGPDHPRIGTADELARAVEYGRITLGAHGWSHANLCALGPAELQRELVMPDAWLRARFDCVVPFLSYPYGLSSPAVEAAAAQTGYRAAFRVDGGWMSRGGRDRPHALPRFNVPAGLSLDGFRLRLAGIGAAS